MENEDAIAALAALAQASRLAIFRYLVEIGPDGVVAGTIAAELALVPATLSFHLKELSHAGLVVGRQEGRFVRYSANFAMMNALIAYLTENCCGGVPCGVACTPKTPPSKPALAKSAHPRARATRGLGRR